MSYTHLTLSKRSKIETFLELGHSIRAIADRMQRSPSTISKELRRHPNCVTKKTTLLESFPSH